jgi:pimeloyl-ACP methyl ester carboxylesterase
MRMDALSAGHGALTAVRAGQGHDIVMLHPLFADRQIFDALLSDLVRQFRVTLIDLPGFHGSEPTVLPLLDAYLARLEDGFQEFAIGSDAVLLGSGFGGTLALSFAIHHPERIGKLVLSATAAKLPETERQIFRDMAASIAAGDIEDVAEAAAQRSVSPAFLAQHPHVIEAHRRLLLGIDPRAFQAACKILAEVDLMSLLDRLAVPTLIVGGDEDRMAPPAHGRAMAGHIVGARYVEFSGCGHCPPLEKPQPFLTTIREFIGA